MANTSSAKKATRVIARRTEVNKSRRSRRDASQCGEPEGVAAHQAVDDTRQVTRRYVSSKRLGDIAGPFLFRAQRSIDRHRDVALVFADVTDECAGNACCRIVTHRL
jgi:hypothetical protein